MRIDRYRQPTVEGYFPARTRRKRDDVTWIPAGGALRKMFNPAVANDSVTATQVPRFTLFDPLNGVRGGSSRWPISIGAYPAPAWMRPVVEFTA